MRNLIIKTTMLAILALSFNTVSAATKDISSIITAVTRSICSKEIIARIKAEYRTNITKYNNSCASYGRKLTEQECNNLYNKLINLRKHLRLCGEDFGSLIAPNAPYATWLQYGPG